MARRQSTPNPDPFDDEFADLDDVQLDDMRVEDMDIEEIDQDEISEPVGLGGSVAREPVGVGQIIGGAIQVILLTVVALAIFLAIGFGVVFAGQRLGFVPMRSTPVSVEVSAAPVIPTAVPQVVETSAAPANDAAPVTTIDCSGGVTWWNSQQVQDNFTYFTQTALGEARESNRIPALMENMRIRRNFVANTPMDTCMDDARAALMRAFDATIEATRVIGTKVEADVPAQIDNINTAYADLKVQLQRVGITVDMPPIR